MSTPDLEKGAGSKRSSQVLENFERASNEQGPSGTFGAKERLSTDQRLSAFLRNDQPGSKHSPQASQHSQHSQHSIDEHTPGSEHPPRPSFMTTQSGSPAVNSDSPNHTVARADIRASAEKILYTYLLPGAEREIILPQGILNSVTDSIEKEGRDDPEVFDTAKDYVFQAMERDAFPGFLRAKALGNIVPPSMMLRLIVGLVSLFGAFWAAFVLIFLDKSRSTRCWLILPFTVGVYFLASHQYMLDPVLAMVGYSEYTFMSFARIKEPFIRYISTPGQRFISLMLTTSQETPQQARDHVPRMAPAYRRRALLSLHLCAWAAAMMVVKRSSDLEGVSGQAQSRGDDTGCLYA